MLKIIKKFTLKNAMVSDYVEYIYFEFVYSYIYF